MKGLFAKDGPAIVPLVLTEAGIRQTGKVLADLDLIVVLRPDGTIISGGGLLAEGGAGLYKYTLSAGVNTQNGTYGVIISATDIDAQSFDYMVGERDISDISDELDTIRGDIAALSGTLTTGDGVKIRTDGLSADGLKADAAAEIADAVCDEALAGHTSAGTLGKAITDIEAGLATIDVKTLDTAAIDSIWEYATANITTAGGIGKLIKDALGSDTLAAIITDLDDIKGTSFVKDTHSLIDIAVNAAAAAAGVALTDADAAKVASAVAAESISVTHLPADGIGRALAFARAGAVGEFEQAAGGGTATLKDTDGSTAKTFTITRDADDNVTKRE